MLLNPDSLGSYPAYDLLRAASLNHIGIDQRWLHALVDQPEKSLPGIVQFAAESHSEDPVALDEDLIAIFHYLKTPLGIPYLSGLIREYPADVTDEVVETFVAIGAPAIAPLLDLHHELGQEQGGEVAFVLSGLGVHDDRILRLLLERLDRIGQEALFHLEVYRDQAAIPELEKRLETAEGEYKLDIENTIADLRVSELDTYVPDYPIFDNYPETNSPDYDLLSTEDRLAFLDSESAEQRAGAASSFFAEDFPVTVRAKLLDMARNDPDAKVRGRCWEDFFDLTDEAELRQAMLERLTDPATASQERAGLAVGLARHTDQPPVRDTIFALAEDPETRAKAVEAMWRSFDPEFGDEAVKHLNDADVEVQRNAIWAIGYLDQQSAAALLRPFFEHDELRPDALHNYALAVPGPSTRVRVQTLFKKIDELAHGLTDGEALVVKRGLDARLERAGHPPFFAPEMEESESAAEPIPPAEPAKAAKVGRNDPCSCGSGKKFKKCCGL